MQLRNAHKTELDELKMKQFSIITFLRTTLRGLQQTYEDILVGKLERFSLDKCTKC
jgi:hypothetical protein